MPSPIRPMAPGNFSVVRRAFAKQVLAAARVDDPRLERALGRVRREDFLGPGPWPVFRWGAGYIDTPNPDPVYLYTDDLVGLSPERQINNGQPSLHALLLHHAAIQEGEHVVHVGAGVGYYSAVMAHLAGKTGRVTAIEFEPDLAARAAANLDGVATVIEGDGAAVAFDPADVIYVNAGATRPVEAWLDGLTEGGRLVLPLTSDEGFGRADGEAAQRRGAVFLVTRQGDGYTARWLSPVAIYPCQGARDPESERALSAAFDRGGWRRVNRLRRSDAVPEEECWVKAPGWCLTYV